MNYEVIARRYRPRRFDEVVGQESIAQTLRAGIIQDRLAHAYLFCGPRGVGKTSLARIFAKALNCPVASDRSGDESNWAVPCNECATCEAIHSGQDIDVIEMDGASHRGIDDIRAVVEGVNRPATRGGFKVYIIDEVHMLTREAFNALLKTLEEPPSHVKFIFATTEVHKIPDTVLSRCQRFDVQPIRLEDIVRRLRQICEAEEREADDELLRQIARYSRGGLRDSQTLLDQLMTFCEGGALNLEDLDRITGRVSQAIIGDLVAALMERRTQDLLRLVRESFQAGSDPAILLEQVIESLHGSFVDRIASGSESEGDVDRLVASLQILVETAQRLKNASYPDIRVEVALVKLSRLEDPRSLDRAIEALQRIEASPGGAAPVAAATPVAGPGPGTAGPPGGGRGGAPVDYRPNPDVVTGPPAGRVPPRGPDHGPPGGPSAMTDVAGPQASAPPPQAAQGFSAPGLSGPDGSTATAVSEAPAPPAAPAPAEPAPPPAPPQAEAAAETETAPAPSGTCDWDRLSRLWEQIGIELQNHHPQIAPCVRGVVPIALAGTSDTLLLRFGDDFTWKMMEGKRRETVEELVRSVTGQPWNVKLEFSADAPRASSTVATPPGRAPGTPPGGPGGPAGGDAPPPPEPQAPPPEKMASAPSAPGGKQAKKLEAPIVEKAIKIFNARNV